MAGIFPTPTGVPPESAENAYIPAIAPIGGAPRYYGTECQTILYAWQLNALISEILAAVDRLGYAYNSTRVDNLGAALADVIGAIRLDITTAQSALTALGLRMTDAEGDISTINSQLLSINGTLLTHANSINLINAYLTNLEAGQVKLDPPIGGFTNVEAFLNAALPLVGPMPANTIKGNDTGSAAPAADLSPAQVAAMLPLSALGAKGLLDALNNNARTFMNGQGAWAEPPLATTTARGTVPSHPNDNLQVLRGDNTWGAPAGLESGACVLHWGPTAPTGTLKANGAAVALATYPGLISIYCGNANNPTADWGFRCTNPANPTGTRSTTGTHIVLPDARGEFLRGWDDGRGVDTGRNQWLQQSFAIQSHTHSITDPQHAHNLATYVWNGPATLQWTSGIINSAQLVSATEPASTGITVQSTGGTETRPRNLAPLICIKY